MGSPTAPHGSVGFFLSGQRLERRSRHAADAPVWQDLGAHGLIELDGGRVPVQHGPFEASAFPLDGQARQVPQQAAAIALAAVRLAYI